MALMRGVRIQRKRREIETLRKAETIEFELKREMAKLREEKVSLRWSEWFDLALESMRHQVMNSTIASYHQFIKWVHPHWAEREIR